MSYGKLVFQASAWLEVYDPKSETLVLKAVSPSEGEDVLCDLQVETVPDTDPVEYIYSCLSINCASTCILRKRIVPGGVEYSCQCQDHLNSPKGSQRRAAVPKGGKGKKRQAKSKSARKK